MTPRSDHRPAANRLHPIRIDPLAAALVVGTIAVSLVLVSAEPKAGVEWLFRLLTDVPLTLLWAAACWGAGRALLTHRTCDPSDRVLLETTRLAIGSGAVGLVVLLLGLAGVVGPIAWAVLIIPATAEVVQIVRDIRSRCESADGSTSHTARWLVLPLVVPAGVLLTAALLPPGLLWGDEPAGYDVTSYHLQVPREWLARGAIIPLTHNVFSYFPFGVEIHFFLAMQLRGGAYEGLYVAQLMNASFAAMVPLAVWGVTRRLGLPTAAAATLAAGTLPWGVMLGAVAYVEPALMLHATLSLAWLIRSVDPTQPPVSGTAQRDAGIAGVLAGLACGAKLTGIVVAVILPVLSLLSIIAAVRLAPRATLMRLMTFLAVAVAVFSPWMLRNLAWTGNPVFPERMHWFGQAHFDDGQVERWDAAHAPRPDQRGIAPRLEALAVHTVLDFKTGFVLPLLLLVGGVLVGLSREARRSPQTLLPWLVVVMTILFWLGLTHLQGRFLVTIWPVGIVAVAQLPHARVTRALLLIAGAGGVAVVGHLALDRVRPSVGLLGLEDYTPITRQILGDALAERALRHPGPVVLVGEAEALFYSIDPARLRYRTVFDVPSAPLEPGTWLEPLEPEALVIVFPGPGHLSRLARTYRNLPPIDPGWLNRPGPFVLE